jgi:hypothetical protein
MQENDIVCAGSIKDLAALIQACKFPAKSLFLAEKLPTHVVVKAQARQDLLRFTDFAPDLPFAEYTSGRIFCSQRELRWENHGQSSQIVYTGDKRDLPLLSMTMSVDLSQYELRISGYYLFGERLRPEELKLIGTPAQEGDYAEMRIPRLLRYPVESNWRRVRLQVVEYSDEKTGKVEFFRFQGLEAGEE